MKKNNKALLNTIFANNKNYGIITGNLNLANELVKELTKKSLFKKENSKKIGYLAEVEPTKQLIIDTLDNPIIITDEVNKKTTENLKNYDNIYLASEMRECDVDNYIE